MEPTTEPESTPEPPTATTTARPGGTFFTILFTLAMFANMIWDAMSTSYNGVQNSLILAAMALSPPGVSVGKNLVQRILDRYIGTKS
jgi:hypothetical protein